MTGWRIVLLAVVVASCGAGCSARAWYGGLQVMAANDCRRRPPSDQDACLAQLNRMTYDEYEQARTKAQQ